MSNRTKVVETGRNTVSKKFFDMLEDTVDDFRSGGTTVDDEERARLIATLLSGQAMKYLSDAKTLWPLVTQKLATSAGSPSDYEDVGEPVQTTPVLEPDTTPAYGFGAPRDSSPFFVEHENARLSTALQEATGAEFYKDPSTGTLKVQVGSGQAVSGSTFADRYKQGDEEARSIVHSLVRKASNDPDFDSASELVNAFSKERGGAQDVLSTKSGRDVYDEEELDSERTSKELSQLQTDVQDLPESAQKVILRALTAPAQSS